MKKIIIGEENSGKRIDKFLAKEFFSYTRGELIRRIKNGEALVNEKTVKPSLELKTGDVLEVSFPEQYESFAPNPDIDVKIIYEDDNLIVIDKPAGLQVHPSDNEKKNTLTNWLIAKFPEIVSVHDGSVNAQFRPGIVHRLDKDTSGVMVIAKNKKTLNALKKIFQERNIEKTYIAITHGIFAEKKGVIKKPLARSLNYRKQTIADVRTKTTVREAVTAYAVQKEFGGYSMVEAYPKTGRMHQIRIHFASMSHPIVGDVVYALKNKEDKNATSVSRQLLHAKQLKFKLFDKVYCFISAMPEDFTQFLQTIDEKRDI